MIDIYLLFGEVLRVAVGRVSVSDWWIYLTRRVVSRKAKGSMSNKLISAVSTDCSSNSIYS